jgi:radical SAM superfamily enzyme YgiQ (UPF0313 family)
MIRIGFILPSSDYLHDPFRGDPHTHFQILTVLEWHFGNKVDLELIDLRGVKRHFAKYHIPECDIYLHSVYTLDYDEQISIVNELRVRFPKAKHIAGGPHAIAFEEGCYKVFDSLIQGDGEEVIIEAVNDYTNDGLKKLYRQEKPLDINKYPYPLRKYLPESTIARPGLMTLKNKPGYDKLMSTTVIFSRGCSHSCAFCVMPAVRQYAPELRYRKPELIEEEIEYLKREYGIEGISILDEIGIPTNRKKAIPHLEAIGRTGITWRAQSRVDGLTPELVKLAAQAGCVTMCMGVESVSQRSLDLINKGYEAKRVRSLVHELKKCGIETRLYMILGLPGEQEDIVDRTWEFITDSDPDLVYMSLLTIRPGTEMYNNPKKFGIKSVTSDWSKTMHMFSRYDKEMPTLTFEYEENTPWGKSLSNGRIVGNYLELQDRIKEHGYGPL